MLTFPCFTYGKVTILGSGVSFRTAGDRSSAKGKFGDRISCHAPVAKPLCPSSFAAWVRISSHRIWPSLLDPTLKLTPLPNKLVAMNAYDKAPNGRTYAHPLLRIETDQGVEG